MHHHPRHCCLSSHDRDARILGTRDPQSGRALKMYADVVLNVPIQNFEHLLRAKRMTEGVETDAELNEAALRNLVEEYKAIVRNATGQPFRDPNSLIGVPDIHDPNIPAVIARDAW